MGLLRTEFATYAADGPAGGGAPPEAAPAAAPAAAPEPHSVETPSDEAFVLDAFDAMQVDDLDGREDSAPATAPERVAPVSAPPETAVTPPAQTTPAPVEPGAATPPVPAAAQAPAQQPATTTPAAQQPGEPALAPEKVLERIHEEVVKHQEIFTQKLAETVYKLPEKELENFNEDPAGVIARVAARVHTNVVSSLTRVLSQQMPVYVHGLLQANDRAAKNESEFWQANPFLDKGKHEKMVTDIAVMYKQMNPNASRADFIRTVGAMAMGALGLTAQAVGQRTQPNGAAPAPPVQTPGRVVRNVPPAFQPAGAHASSAPPPPQQLNEWERMTIALEQDGQGAFDT